MTDTLLSVSVTTHDGRPVPGAQVTRTDDAARTGVTTTTDERGYARFDAPSETPARITVIATDFAPDERAVGNGYPTRPDGVEQFVLGPAGWPAYYRGRVRVPFQPILDAVGVRLDEPLAPDETGDRVDGLGDEVVETIRFDDPSVVVVRLPEMERADNDEVVERLARRGEDLGLGQVGALVELNEQGASFLTDTMTVSLLTDDVDPVEVASRHGSRSSSGSAPCPAPTSSARPRAPATTCSTGSRRLRPSRACATPSRA